MKLLLFTLFLFPFISFSQCPPDGTFNSQAEIDAFATNYPNCTTLNDGLLISGEDITNLSGLFQITSASGFVISNNPLLQTLAGLNPNITLYYVEGQGNDFIINNNALLTEISGLENLVNESSFESAFSISDNSMLMSLEGVPNVFGTLSWLTISNNDSLINLNGLENYSAGETTIISNNDNLIDLTGLNSAEGSEHIRISDNDALVSFNGLMNLGGGADFISIENNAVLEDITITNGGSIGYSPVVTIRNNPSLSVCNANWVCSFIYTMGIEEGEWFPGMFDNNAPGCNSHSEVEYGCELNSNDNCGFPNTSDYLVLGETIQANNEFATTSSFTPSCNDFTERQDVWFVFDSEENTSIDVFVDTGFNMQMWEGDCYDLAQVDNGCSSDTLNDVTVSPNTAYYLQVWSDNTGRRASGWFDLLVQDGTLSSPKFELADIHMYPNPVQNELHIQSSLQIDAVEVYSLLGQKVLESKTRTLNFSNLKVGLYLVKAFSNGREFTYKIVKY